MSSLLTPILGVFFVCLIVSLPQNDGKKAIELTSNEVSSSYSVSCGPFSLVKLYHSYRQPVFDPLLSCLYFLSILCCLSVFLLPCLYLCMSTCMYVRHRPSRLYYEMPLLLADVSKKQRRMLCTLPIATTTAATTTSRCR